MHGENFGWQIGLNGETSLVVNGPIVIGVCGERACGEASWNPQERLTGWWNSMVELDK